MILFPPAVFTNAFNASRRSEKGFPASLLLPKTSRSNTTSRAGNLPDSSATRLAAGCRRSCSVSKDWPGMTSSPSRTNRSGLQSGKASDNLREEAVERFLFLGLQIDLVAVAEGEAAKAVIFGLVEPPLAARQIIDRLGFHRLQRQRNG